MRDETPVVPRSACPLIPATEKVVPTRALLLLLALFTPSCDRGPRLEIVTPRRGEVLTSRDVAVAWRLVGALPSTGDHYHVFLDRDLPAVGEPIPLHDDGIAHVFGDTTFTFREVNPGAHRVTVVLGDAGHRARGGLYRASVPFRTRLP